MLLLDEGRLSRKGRPREGGASDLFAQCKEQNQDNVNDQLCSDNHNDPWMSFSAFE